MNWKRGLFRTWIALSALWLLLASIGVYNQGGLDVSWMVVPPIVLAILLWILAWVLTGFQKSQ